MTIKEKETDKRTDLQNCSGYNCDRKVSKDAGQLVIFCCSDCRNQTDDHSFGCDRRQLERGYQAI
jgi:hypothetical protein